MDAISAMDVLTHKNPIHDTRCIQMKPAVPPLNKAKNEVPERKCQLKSITATTTVPSAVSQVDMSTMEKPKIDISHSGQPRLVTHSHLRSLTNLKLRLNSCCLPKRYMSFASSPDILVDSTTSGSSGSSASLLYTTSFASAIVTVCNTSNAQGKCRRYKRQRSDLYSTCFSIVEVKHMWRGTTSSYSPDPMSSMHQCASVVLAHVE